MTNLGTGWLVTRELVRLETDVLAQMKRGMVIIRSDMRKVMHLTVPKGLMSRVPKVKSTMRGIIVMANEVARQRACSEWVGYSKYVGRRK